MLVWHGIIKTSVFIFLSPTIGLLLGLSLMILAGSIVGVGATKRFSAVRWGAAGSIVWAWILTIPFSALISAFTLFCLQAIF